MQRVGVWQNVPLRFRDSLTVPSSSKLAFNSCNKALRGKQSRQLAGLLPANQSRKRKIMTATPKTPWRIAGDEAVNYNCAWGCPCQFNALPTTGRCEAWAGWQIHEGHFGATRLNGVRFARIMSWPGPI